MTSRSWTRTRFARKHRTARNIPARYRPYMEALGSLSPEIIVQISGTLHAGGTDTVVFDHSQVTGSIVLTGGTLTPAGHDRRGRGGGHGGRRQ
jgi:hypothetical protein